MTDCEDCRPDHECEHCANIRLFFADGAKFFPEIYEEDDHVA